MSSVVVAVVAVVGILIGAQRHNSNSRNRIYERFDEFKGQIENKIVQGDTRIEGQIAQDYARKDLCSVTHTQVDLQLKEIKEQTALIPSIAAQLNVLINGKSK